MRLSKLIEETLSEIALGVKVAKENSRSLLVIAPGTVGGRIVAEISYIEFDVSIVVAEGSGANRSDEKGVGGEIRVLSIGGIGGKTGTKKDDTSSSSLQLSHRISFKVPVCMGAEY